MKQTISCAVTGLALLNATCSIHQLVKPVPVGTYALPKIGNLPVNDIDTQHVLSVLQPIWTTKTETATHPPGLAYFVAHSSYFNSIA